MTYYEAWLRGCEINHTLIYKLDDTVDYPETGFYKLTREVIVKWQVHYDTPVYMVWWRGKQLAATTNYGDAYGVWARTKSVDAWKPFEELPEGSTLDDWLELRDQMIAEGRIRA